MLRFYEAAEAEEAELKLQLEKKDNKDTHTGAIPKIQINYEGEEQIDLERRLSLRRRYSGGITAPNQVLWTQKRHSLRNSGDLSDVLEGKLHKFPLTMEEKREIMMNRTRSESEEKEEKQLKEVRMRSDDDVLKSQQHSIKIIDQSKWEEEAPEDEEEYEESLSEEETESSEEDDRIYDQVPDVGIEDEEDIIYNPREKTFTNPTVFNNEPFVILTKPNKLPDPNFVPKPILKKVIDENVAARHRSRSLASDSLVKESTKTGKRGSLPWGGRFDFRSSESKRRASSPTVTSKTTVQGTMDISKAAGLSGLTAAGVVITQPLLKKQSESEVNVIANHYADIVENYGKRKRLPKSIVGTTIQGQRKYSNVQLLKEDRPESNVEYPSVKSSYDSGLSSQKSPKTSEEDFGHGSNGFSNRSHRQMFPPPKVTERRGSPAVLQKDVIRLRTTEQRLPAITPVQSVKSKSPSKSPGRSRSSSESNDFQEWHTKLKRSPSPLRADFSTQTKATSPFNEPSAEFQVRKRAPKLREIMTQTSASLEGLLFDTTTRLSASFNRKSKNEELRDVQMKVRTTVDYITDLAMFVVACWLYLFKNELLAIPVLLIMVYRQLQSEIIKRLPKWVLKKSKK